MATFITSKAVGETIDINVDTTTGYFKYNHDGVDSEPLTTWWKTITITNANGEFTIKPCDSNGNITGDITILNLENIQITSFNSAGLSSLQGLMLGGNQLTSIDVTGLSNLITLYLYNNQLTSFNSTGLYSLIQFYCQNNPITSFDSTDLNSLQLLSLMGCPLTPLINDEILNKLNSNGISSGQFNSNNGRTAASNTAYNNLLNNLTWTLSGLDLVSGPVVGNGKLAIRGVNSGGGTTTTTTTEAPTTTTTTTETPVTTTTTTQGPTNYTFNPSLSPNYSSFTFTVETTPPQKDGGIIDIVNLFITVKESSTIFQPYVKLYYVTASDIANNNLGIYADGGQFVGTSTPGVMKTGNFYFNTTDPKGLPLNGTTPVSGLTFRVRISELADTDTVLEEFLYTV